MLHAAEYITFVSPRAEQVTSVSYRFHMTDLIIEERRCGRIQMCSIRYKTCHDSHLPTII